MLEVACHRCERRGQVSLARLIDNHGPDTGLPDLWESLAGDCQHARSTALNNGCAIYYPQLPDAGSDKRHEKAKSDHNEVEHSQDARVDISPP
jgi:hypothetical protein